MAQLPTLKTGATVQHPVWRETRYPTRVLQFLDRREQRFPLGRGGFMRWELEFRQLDEGEAQRLVGVLAQDGGSLDFVDPISGTVREGCFAGGDMALVVPEEGQVNLRVTVEEKVS
jgi:hypothetical protein